MSVWTRDIDDNEVRILVKVARACDIVSFDSPDVIRGCCLQLYDLNSQLLALNQRSRRNALWRFSTSCTPLL